MLFVAVVVVIAVIVVVIVGVFPDSMVLLLYIALHCTLEFSL